jgi:hypothetical protein
VFGFVGRFIHRAGSLAREQGQRNPGGMIQSGDEHGAAAEKWRAVIRLYWKDPTTFLHYASLTSIKQFRHRDLTWETRLRLLQFRHATPAAPCRHRHRHQFRETAHR